MKVTDEMVNMALKVQYEDGRKDGVNFFPWAGLERNLKSERSMKAALEAVFVMMEKEPKPHKDDRKSMSTAWSCVKCRTFAEKNHDARIVKCLSCNGGLVNPNFIEEPKKQTLQDIAKEKYAFYKNGFDHPSSHQWFLCLSEYLEKHYK